MKLKIEIDGDITMYGSKYERFFFLGCVRGGGGEGGGGGSS